MPVKTRVKKKKVKNKVTASFSFATEAIDFAPPQGSAEVLPMGSN